MLNGIGPPLRFPRAITLYNRVISLSFFSFLNTRVAPEIVSEPGLPPQSRTLTFLLIPPVFFSKFSFSFVLLIGLLCDACLSDPQSPGRAADWA